MKKLLYPLILLNLIACEPSNSQEKNIAEPRDFNGYWYAGEAEITSYELQQARYGEIHTGEAVLIFVTEPFSKSKHVKLDNWKDESEDNVSVMKLNMTKKFLTGIYPYSMMMSTFTPVSEDKYPNTFKITTSSQEWCGHTWMQVNLQDEGYRLRGFSYFESEGDVDLTIPQVPLEDELWTRIRLNPDQLPVGKIKLFPSTFYQRLKHRPLQPQEATATLRTLSKSAFSTQPHKMYEIKYDERTLKIYFEAVFPFSILGWEETYLSGFGNPQMLTTKAKRIRTMNIPYWERNSNKDRQLRKELGLSPE